MLFTLCGARRDLAYSRGLRGVHASDAIYVTHTHDRVIDGRAYCKTVRTHTGMTTLPASSSFLFQVKRFAAHGHGLGHGQARPAGQSSSGGTAVRFLCNACVCVFASCCYDCYDYLRSRCVCVCVCCATSHNRSVYTRDGSAERARTGSAIVSRARTLSPPGRSAKARPPVCVCVCECPGVCTCAYVRMHFSMFN